ncbi:tubulin binding cofactor A [Viridothelium virens]|uniref:Tubulin-specific chaperone A n=1 Tax=Viridothelium virens TaxID=1048519 RepID=A0A6A6GZD9_VIRVR|nr:tubulin binding cofactor A [Viridothelium virens]
MAPPSQLSIATSAVQRLVHEEASYHKELEQQKKRIEKAEQNTDDENAEYQLKQERRALEETKAVFPSLRKRIDEAVAKLEQQLESGKESGDPAPVEEINKAKAAVVEAKKAMREIA